MKNTIRSKIKTIGVVIAMVILSIIWSLFFLWATIYLRINETYPWLDYQKIGNPFPPILFKLCITFLLLVIYFRGTYNLGKKLKIVLNVVLSIFLMMNFSFLGETISYLMILYGWEVELPFFSSLVVFNADEAGIYSFFGIMAGVFIFAFPFSNLVEWIINFVKKQKHIVNYTILFMVIFSIGFFAILPKKHTLNSFNVIPDTKVTIKGKQLIFGSQQFDSSVKIDFVYHSKLPIPDKQFSTITQEVHKFGGIEDRIITFAFFAELNKKLEGQVYDWKEWAKENFLGIDPNLREIIDLEGVLITKRDTEKRSKLLKDGAVLYQKCFLSDENYNNCFEQQRGVYDAAIKELVNEFGRVEIELDGMKNLVIEASDNNADLLGDIFESKKFGFTIRFPKGWNIQETEYGVKASSNNLNEIEVTVPKIRDIAISDNSMEKFLDVVVNTIKNTYKVVPDSIKIEKNKVLINGMEGFMIKVKFDFRLYSQDIYKGDRSAYLFLVNGIPYVISVSEFGSANFRVPSTYKIKNLIQSSINTFETTRNN